LMPPFGMAMLKPSDVVGGVTLEIPLTAAGVDYLELTKTMGPTVFGGKLSSITDDDMTTTDVQELFGLTGPIIGIDPTPTPELELTTVPEPSTCLLFVMGLVSYMAWLRKSRRRV